MYIIYLVDCTWATWTECKKNTTLEDEIMQRTVWKEELEELKTKEVAYKETIQKADAILSKVSTIVPKQNVVRMH